MCQQFVSQDVLVFTSEICSAVEHYLFVLHRRSARDALNLAFIALCSWNLLVGHDSLPIGLDLTLRPIGPLS